MSSPLSNLKKTHKAPFLGNRPMPFRHPEYTEDESKLLEEITQKMVQEKMKKRDPFGGGLPKLDKTTSFTSTFSDNASSSVPPGTSPPGPPGPPGPVPPTDQELMRLMMRRVATLEQRTKEQAREIAERDMKIKVLEEKLTLYKKLQDRPTQDNSRELEKRCLHLQQQVQDMEEFLADYGMVWVGDRDDSSTSPYNELEEEEVGSDGESLEAEITRTWTESGTPPWMDYNTFVSNIQDLNVIAGEGVARVQRTTGGAKFKIPESVPLSVYANGIALYSGPFRPYTEATCQRFVHDVLDGYFPSEMQERHPEGVPFALHDLRNVVYEDNRHRQELFKGSGQVLGGQDGQSRLVSSTSEGCLAPKEEKASVAAETTSQLPGQRITTEQLLNRLPRSVVRSGKVIDIRNSVAETLQGSSGKPEVALVETSVTKEMKQRLESAEKRRPSTPREITTLRIKTGENTLIVKMKFRETIGDLRNYLKQHQPKGAPEFEIYSAYPSQVYSDDKKTLEECDLVPNGVLHLRPQKR